METTAILLAFGDRKLRGPYRRLLEHRGHYVVEVERPLEVLSLSDSVRWDLALVDESSLGLGCLDALSLGSRCLLVGLGFEDERLSASVRLPLQSDMLISTLEALLFRDEGTTSAALILNPLRRVASRGGREVILTRTEFRLLQLLHERRPADVTLSEILVGIWGSAEGQGTSELVRAHLRNLRRKLGEIGLTDVVRARRGRGYALEL